MMENLHLDVRIMQFKNPIDLIASCYCYLYLFLSDVAILIQFWCRPVVRSSDHGSLGSLSGFGYH